MINVSVFSHLHDPHKRGHLFSHELGVSMPRPFRKGIACHGSMPVRPFSPESFVALYNDDTLQNDYKTLSKGKLHLLVPNFSLNYCILT